MAITLVSGNYANWWQQYRSGTAGSAAPVYSGLVSDLAVNDFLVGARAKITAKSGTNPITLTLDRLGTTFTVSYPSTATIIFMRP